MKYRAAADADFLVSASGRKATVSEIRIIGAGNLSTESVDKIVEHRVENAVNWPCPGVFHFLSDSDANGNVQLISKLCSPLQTRGFSLLVDGAFLKCGCCRIFALAHSGPNTSPPCPTP